MRNWAVVIAVLLAWPAAAEVYRYVDKDGVVHYTDKPPDQQARPAKLPPILTYEAQGAPPEGFFEEDKPASSGPSAGSMPPPPRFSVSITAPTPGETLRDTGDALRVAVAVAPALPAGYGLIYFLDGAAQNAEPLMQTSLSLQGAFRGEHTVEVALIDPQGREVARSAPVAVYMKQPVVSGQSPFNPNPGQPKGP